MQEIDGVPTDIAVSIFVDRVFIVVTQLGTFGTLVDDLFREGHKMGFFYNYLLLLQIEAQQKDSISGKFQSDIHIRLGRRDDPLLLVYARQFLEHFGYVMARRCGFSC